MLIDWFTVIAQALNFLVLVWLMKRFLYKPILHAIDEREKRVAAELADAAATKSDANKERDEFQHKNEEFDQQRSVLLSKATDEAKTERRRLLDEARREADALCAKRKEMLKKDTHNLNQAICLRTKQEVFAIARKSLMDLAGASLEERMIDVFIDRLRALDGEGKEQLISAFTAAHTTVTVRTAFELSPVLSDSTERAIKETLGTETLVLFETAQEMISGIQLTTDGHKVAWSLADYLVSLEKGVEELLNQNDRSEAKIAAAQEEDHGI
jgi:F-type H+-transporting ATPase subunit b